MKEDESQPSCLLTHGRVEALDVKLVFDRDGQAVKGTDELASAFEVSVQRTSSLQSEIEGHLRQTVQLEAHNRGVSDQFGPVRADGEAEGDGPAGGRWQPACSTLCRRRTP